MAATGAPLGLHPLGLAPPLPGVGAPFGPPVISRFIDPVIRDYELDAATGQFASMPPVRQRVSLALGTERGTSAVLPTLGTEHGAVQDAQFVRTTQNDARAAAVQLLAERVIRIRDIRVTTGKPTGRSLTVFEYEDLTQSQQAPSRKDTVETPALTP